MLEKELIETFEFVFSEIAGMSGVSAVCTVLGTIAAFCLFCGLWLIF